MIIDAVSDLHGFYPTLNGGDLLIIAGDLTKRDTLMEHSDMLEWINKQPYKKKVLVAGNHDGFLEKNPNFYSKTNIDYLCDSGTEFEGFKIFGSPYTTWFEGVNPKCAAFMCHRGEDIAAHWNKIPIDTDILVTHGPPYQVLDRTWDDRRVGCEELKKRLRHLDWRPRLHAFGHIHEAYGTMPSEKTDFVNCSHVNEKYKPVNKPIRIIFD